MRRCDARGIRAHDEVGTAVRHLRLAPSMTCASAAHTTANEDPELGPALFHTR